LLNPEHKKAEALYSAVSAFCCLKPAYLSNNSQTSLRS
jgi:hypothetical protein